MWVFYIRIYWIPQRKSKFLHEGVTMFSANRFLQLWSTSLPILIEHRPLNVFIGHAHLKGRRAAHFLFFPTLHLYARRVNRREGHGVFAGTFIALNSSCPIHKARYSLTV